VGGLDALPSGNKEVRETINEEAALRGWPALHAELARVDPRSAQRISPGDSQRIQRALEVWRLTGKPLSALHGAAKSELPFRLKAFALVPRDRAELHRRIAARFAAMLQAGLVDEVKALRRNYRLTPGMPSMRAVGYRQVWQYLEGDIDAATLAERAVAATRQLAKRQLTWLRRFPDVEHLDASPAGMDVEALASRIAHSFL
jgi:tRNA dimethylallyltransferase